jgi:LL-diaminopimelate aminotransferase
MISRAKRLQDIQEYYFSKKLGEIAVLNAEGHDIINLGIGSPDMPPPHQAVQALTIAANNQAAHGYQSYKGTPALRNAFCDWYQTYYQVTLNPDLEVLPLMGSKEGITYISNTYLNEGDEVLIPNPGYPAYAAATKIAGGLVREYDLKEENNWLPDLQALQEQDLTNVKLMWINYPHMPTGALASRADFEALIRFAERNHILLCHDNPYSFVLNDAPLSILSVSGISEHVLELNSLSKSHNMAGWRVGMVAGHAKHIQHILVAKSNVDSGMFLGIQQAAVAALQMPPQWYYDLNVTYRERREIVWQLMDELECSYSRQQAGLFVWGRVSDDVNEAGHLVDELLYRARVFITPGFIFGSNGNRHIRVSLCADTERLATALQRIKEFKTSK